MERQPTAWNTGRRTFPKRDELLLRDVLALPKLSKMGVEPSTCWLTCPSRPPPRTVRNERTIFAVSVLPAPLSPEMTIDCGSCPDDGDAMHICWYASSAVPNGWGLSGSNGSPT